MRDSPIRCVQIGAHITAQGPVDTSGLLPGEPAEKTDMHGKLTVRVGDTTTATGAPIPSMRGGCSRAAHR